jgi:hypothetical protein
MIIMTPILIIIAKKIQSILIQLLFVNIFQHIYVYILLIFQTRTKQPLLFINHHIRKQSQNDQNTQGIG